MKQVERMRRMQAITRSYGSPRRRIPWSMVRRIFGRARPKARSLSNFFCSRSRTVAALRGSGIHFAGFPRDGFRAPARTRFASFLQQWGATPLDARPARSRRAAGRAPAPRKARVERRSEAVFWQRKPLPGILGGPENPGTAWRTAFERASVRLIFGTDSW